MREVYECLEKREKSIIKKTFDFFAKQYHYIETDMSVKSYCFYLKLDNKVFVKEFNFYTDLDDENPLMIDEIKITTRKIILRRSIRKKIKF